MLEDAEEQAGTATAPEGTVSQTPQPSSTAETDITGAVPAQQPSSEDSPPHSPVRFEAITGQPSLETSAAALFAVTSDASASDANASGQHMVTAAGTTAGDGNTTSEIERPEQEFSFHGATKASTAVITDAVSFGMTSTQPASPVNIATTAVAASPTATDAQLLPIFPEMPAFVVLLMTGVNRSALILSDDKSSMPLLDWLLNPLGCSSNPPGSNPNPPGWNPIPPGSNPNPLGCHPNPTGCDPNPPGRGPNPPGCDPNLPGCDPDNLGNPKGHSPYSMGSNLSLNPMSNYSTHYAMSGNPAIMDNNPNAMGYKPSNIPYMGALCMFPESTRGATWTNLNNAGIRDQGLANGMYAAEQANLPIPLESHFLRNTGRYRRPYAYQEVRDDTPEELLQGQALRQQFSPQHQ